MIYEDEKLTREDLFELRRQNVCATCSGMLNVFMDFDRGRAYLACNSDQAHEGLEKEAPPPFEPNIPTRREMMVEQLGEEKATQLERYEGVVSLTRVQAMEILKTIWPLAPEVEVLKAAIICHQYGLNPLLKHIFLIPFKRRKEGKVVGEDWAVVQGISSNRLIARRRHNYSYLDLTPRRMNEEEQEKINGEVDDTKIWAITKLKDLETRAEATGVGSWPVDEVPYGTDKGNTKLNMACIRSEREALDRLYPADMPHGIEVMEEKYIDTNYTLIAKAEPLKGGGKIGEPAQDKAASRTIPQQPAGAETIEQGAGEAGATILPPTKTPKPKKIAAPPARDPSTIKSFGELFQALWDDYHITKTESLNELNVHSQEEITELPSECYRRIAIVRA